MKKILSNVIKGFILTSSVAAVGICTITISNNSLKESNKDIPSIADDKVFQVEKTKTLVESENRISENQSKVESSNEEIVKSTKIEEDDIEEIKNAEESLENTEKENNTIESKKEEEKNNTVESKKAEEKNNTVESKKTEKQNNIVESEREEEQNDTIESKKAEEQNNTIESKKEEENSAVESEKSNETNTEEESNSRTFTEEQLKYMLEQAKKGEKIDQDNYEKALEEKGLKVPEEKHTVEFHFYSTLNPITVYRNYDEEFWSKCGKDGAGCIWFAEFSCDMNECEGFSEPGSNLLSGKVLIGRRGDILKYTMVAPKGKPGYRFKQWEIISDNKVVSDNEYEGILVNRYRAIYEKY